MLGLGKVVAFGLGLFTLGWYAWKKPSEETTTPSGATKGGGFDPAGSATAATGLECDAAMSKLPSELQAEIADAIKTKNAAKLGTIIVGIASGVDSNSIDKDVGLKVLKCLDPVLDTVKAGGDPLSDLKITGSPLAAFASPATPATMLLAPFFKATQTEWPNFQALPSPYKEQVFDAVKGFIYPNALNGTTPFFGNGEGAPSSTVISEIANRMSKDPMMSSGIYGGIGGTTTKALADLDVLYKRIRALGY